MNLQQLRNRGFTASTHVPFTKQFRVRCEQCEALVLNSIPTHETGCPAAMHECNGCNALIPARQRYCEDCT